MCVCVCEGGGGGGGGGVKRGLLTFRLSVIKEKIIGEMNRMCNQVGSLLRTIFS